ncbi:MAG: HAD family phosphatase [Treponema sp.]|nr:HAD family phosphatase [Treponema sp.]
MSGNSPVAVVFDMDGVLFDSERISRMMWARVGTEYGLSDIDTAVRDCTGSSRPDQFVYLRKKYGADFPAEAFRERCSFLFHSYVDANGLPLMPFAREILVYLKKQGYRLALASSTQTKTVLKELGEAGLLDFFETVTCGDMVVHSKPDPEIYIRACESLGLVPRFCVAVEDSPNGVRSAYAAGMRCVMVPDQIQPDGQLRSLLWQCCASLEELMHFL